MYDITKQLTSGSCSYKVHIRMYVYIIQWDLSVKDTLGPANLSTVERLSTLQR